MINLLFKDGKQITTPKGSSNSVKDILNWAINALRESDITAIEKKCLFADVEREIYEGKVWRGSISDIWKAKGYTAVDIPDLYV